MRKFLLLSVLILASCYFLPAQNYAAFSGKDKKFNAVLVGLKGGYSSYHTSFSVNPYSDAEFLNVSNYVIAAFAEFPINSVYGLSVSAEAALVERGFDIKYTFRNVYDSQDVLNAKYLDLRIPLTYRFFPSKVINPYLFVSPELCFCYGGENTMNIGDYHYVVDISESDAVINPIDLGLAFGGGLRFNIPMNEYYLVLKLDMAYHLGLLNTISKKALNGDVSYINVNATGNQPLGYRGNKGFEAMITLGFPLIHKVQDACMGFGNRKY